MSSPKKGATTLLVVFMVMTLLFGFGLFLATISSSEYLAERRVERGLRARYVAESGLALAYSALTKGGLSFSVDRDLLDGHLLVQSHPVAGRPRQLDLLSHALVDDRAVLLFTRIEINPPLMVASGSSSNAGVNVVAPSVGTSGGPILVLFQLCVPRSLIAPQRLENLKPASLALHSRLENHYHKVQVESRKVWNDRLSHLGRRQIHALCRQAVNKLIGIDGDLMDK